MYQVEAVFDPHSLLDPCKVINLQIPIGRLLLHGLKNKTININGCVLEVNFLHGFYCYNLLKCLKINPVEMTKLSLTLFTST